MTRGTSAPAVAVLNPRHSSCFPIVSFLHVPGKMSKPLWLMMGTAFPFHLPAAEGAPTTSPQLLLTAKHTFAPWDYAKDASQLKIPDDYRKLRFVIGKLYRPSAAGRSVAADAVSLRLVSQHPHLDVAVVAVDVKAETARETAAAGAPPPPTTRLSFETTLELSTEDRYPAAADGLIAGFRGAGKLGELDTLDPSLLQRLPPAERDALLTDLQDVEGKQEYAETTVSILDEKGMCKGTGDRAACFHGMSGGPLLTTTGRCAGVLYGHHPDAPGCLGYTPCADFAKWLGGVVQRVNHRKQPE